MTRDPAQDPRPYVVLSAAVSVDGFIDDATGDRLLLSNEADFDRVDEVRSGVDAILVGAGTVRRDDPRLLVRSPRRRADRVARGLPADPIKVTVTAGGDLDPAARFFSTGDGEKLVYAARSAVGDGRNRLGGRATVLAAGDPLDLHTVLEDLAARGVRRLLVEGGGTVHTGFLTAGLADEVHLVVAPFFVGDPAAPRFANPGSFPHGPANRMRLAEVRQIGDVVLLRYLLDRTDRDSDRLARAIALSRACPPSRTAFSVGAVITDADGQVIATGYSRESDPHDHAEEAALAKLAVDDPRLPTATIYSSLEPCTRRASRPRSCTDLILAAGIRRVVFGWREPAVFVDCTGAETLRDAGATVIEIADLADQVAEVNAHLL